MTPAEKAQALASDLRYVLRKHKAQITWKEVLDARVMVTVVIEDAASPRTFIKHMGGWFRRTFF